MKKLCRVKVCVGIGLCALMHVANPLAVPKVESRVSSFRFLLTSVTRTVEMTGNLRSHPLAVVCVNLMISQHY